jgi:hypothetical protein
MRPQVDRARSQAVRRAVAALAACGVLLVAGCSAIGGSGSGTPAAPVSRTPAAQAGGRSERAALTRAYLTIAASGNRHLQTDFDGLAADHGNLAAARAYLRDAASTERLFDRRLLRLPLTAPMTVVARLLVAANEARARLTAQAAGSTSFAQLRGYERRLTAANAPVEDGVRVIRSMLGLPPPETS